MSQKELIKLFENRNVRVVWDDEKQEWYFSVVDVCGVMVDSKDYQTARKYWNKLKERLRKEGNESVTNCHQLKLQAASLTGYLEWKDHKSISTECKRLLQEYRR